MVEFCFFGYLIEVFNSLFGCRYVNVMLSGEYDLEIVEVKW